VRCRKLELEHFLGQHVDMSLKLYICHPTHIRTAGGGTAILVRRGIAHHSVPVPGLTQLEATAIQIVLAGRQLKIIAVFPSPSHSLIGADLEACLVSANRTALDAPPISDAFRGANQVGRHNSLSGGDPRQTTHLVASHRIDQQENCSKNGCAGSCPEQEG
jgi:hypothetical protein